MQRKGKDRRSTQQTAPDALEMDTWDCLIVDDEQMLTEAAEEYLNLLGVRTKGVLSAGACRDFLSDNTARVIVLDINLEEESGFSLCRELREVTNVPIIFLSARTSDDDKIAAYTVGDDYVQKPCALSVLTAKVKAVLRREASKHQDVYDDGRLYVDIEAQTVLVCGKPVHLTATEFRLLAYLVQHRGQAVPKQRLFEAAWEDAAVSDSTLNVHIRHLREQIERSPSQPVYIRTVHGVGYRFDSKC